MPLGFHKATLFGVAGVSTGDVVLLHDEDYTGVTSAAITSGINSTYGEYIFKFYNINPSVDNASLAFQVNAVGESDYDEVMTTTMFQTYHDEADGSTNLGYDSSRDQAQGTAYQSFGEGIGNDADVCLVGELHLFNPSSTTYVKHFYAYCNMVYNGDYSMGQGLGGYINTTAAIDDIDFKISSGNFDGTIKMWGVK